MDRFPRLPLGLAAAALFCVCLTAQPANHSSQQSGQSPALQYGRQTPFSIDRKSPSISTDVQFLSPERMSAADRRLQADSQADIARRAGYNALQFNPGEWSYRQIVCRALPNHLFLRYTRGAGARDRSVFTVSIPRNGQGHVRLIPVLRRGYSLFSPASSNAGTIAAFNQIRREDGAGPNAEWLETALCYAALAGSNPRIGALTGDAALSEPAPALAEMEVPVKGGAIIRFTDQDSRPRPTLWIMTFNSHGTLLKVQRQRAVESPQRAVPEGQKFNGKIVPTSAR